MNILILVAIFVVLTAILSARWSTDLSVFELNRRAEKNRDFAKIQQFREIYPGFLIFSRILALIFATVFVILLFQNFGFLVGWISSLILLIFSWIFSRFLSDFAKKIFDKHLDFWLKYFAWTGVFSRISRLDGEVKIASKNELLHVISNADFLDENEKKSLQNSANFREKTAREIMIPARNVKFVHAKDELTPLFIDELFESGHRIFPVVNSRKNELEHVVGLVDLDDFREISAADFQEKMEVADAMRPIEEPIAAEKNLAEMLEFFAKNHTTFALISRDEKIVGIANLGDVLKEIL